jgi:hypothetical protein
VQAIRYKTVDFYHLSGDVSAVQTENTIIGTALSGINYRSVSYEYPNKRQTIYLTKNLYSLDIEYAQVIVYSFTCVAVELVTHC